MTRVAEACVDKCWVIHGSDLIEKIKCNFSSPDRLLLGVNQILSTKDIRFMKVHDCNVVKAAENIKMYFTSHEGGSLIE